VLPLVARTCEALSTWLSPAYSEPLTLRADTDSLDALSSEREALWTRLEKASFLTTDEKRAAIGYGPMPTVGLAQKINIHHDPDNGRFDFAPNGPLIHQVQGKKPYVVPPPVTQQPQKVPKAGQSGAEASDDTPSWVHGNKPNVGESSDAFARRMLEKQYPGRPINPGTDTEYSRIKKWADRHFTDPKKPK
jgi:hypothetical protein